jgi:hypothetical protein
MNNEEDNPRQTGHHEGNLWPRWSAEDRQDYSHEKE